MISYKYKTVFIHVPKCAGTSIGNILRKKSFVYQTHHHVCHQELNSEYKNYFKFAFVRNPFDKMASEYKWFTNTEHEYPLPKVKEFYRGKSFKSFLETFLNTATRKHRHRFGDPYHSLSYMTLLQPIEQIDFIGKVENLQEDFNVVCDKIGISKQELPHKNKSKYKHYTEYYDDETRQIVAEKYAKDIEYFGYEYGE